MPIGSGASNKAQRGVVEKKAKSGGGCELDEDKAFKAKQVITLLRFIISISW